MGNIPYAPFNRKQANYIRNAVDPKNWLCILEGGKRAGKNIINIVAWCAILETHPDKFHLAAGVSVAMAKLNIIESNGFGVMYYFAGRCKLGKYQDKDALIVQTKVGEKIILIAGGGKSGDERYIKGLTIGSAYVSEANECAQSFIRELFDRTISSNQRKIIFDLNPKTELHWFYTDILNVHQAKQAKIPNYGYLYEHMTIADNMSMTDDQIAKELTTYDKNSIWYQRDILGLRKNAEGLIYTCWNEEENSYDDSTRPANLYVMRRNIGIDFGDQNPTVFLDSYYDGRTLWVDKEYYYSGRDERKSKTISMYVTDLADFIGHGKVGNRLNPIGGVIVDPSAASLKTECQANGIRTINADNDVTNGIYLMADMIQKRILRVHKRCTHFRGEINAYMWDDKKSKLGTDIPLKENDHCMDSCRYIIKTTINPLRIARG